MANPERISKLLMDRLRGPLSIEEASELESWAQESPANRDYINYFGTKAHTTAMVHQFDMLLDGDGRIEKRKAELWKRIEKLGPPKFRITNWDPPNPAQKE